MSYLALPAAVPVMKILRLACSLYPDIIDGVRCVGQHILPPCQPDPQARTNRWRFSAKVLAATSFVGFINFLGPL